MQASPRRCYGYANNTVICEDGPPLCPTLTTGAKTQLLKCGVEQNAQADRLEGTFWVAVRGQPNQEISVRMSVQSSYPYPGTVVSLSQIPGSRSHMASQAKVQHLRDSYDIQIMQLYFTKLKKWLACSAGCTQTLTVVRGF